MFWLKKFWNNIVTSNDYTYINTIDHLSEDLQVLQNDYDELYLEHVNVKQQFNTLKQEVSVFKKTVFDVSNNYYFNNIKQEYRFKPGQKDYLHLIFEDFLTNKKLIKKYEEFVLSLKPLYNLNPDNIVFKVTVAVQEYINSVLPDDYKTDKEVYGVNEYWLSPVEAFEQYVNNSLAVDCEDTSMFLYCCITAILLKEGFESSVWRLKRVDVVITGSGGHALLAWLKSSMVWVPVESTFGESNFSYNWKLEANVFKSMYSKLWHIFDSKGEYRLK